MHEIRLKKKKKKKREEVKLRKLHELILHSKKHPRIDGTLF